MFRFTFALLASVHITQAGALELPLPANDADFVEVNQDEAKLGQLLFWDPILSGNKNISCGTCHHPKFGTGDGVSLSLGEGGIGLGPDRRVDPDNMPEQRIPRNAPALFNLGAKQFTVMFHDGRIEADPARPSGIRTPLDEDMMVGFSGILSAQTMFPVLSQDEMAGHYSENEISKAVRRGIITGEGGAWDLISKRVAAIDEYRTRFEAVYPEIADGKPIAFTDISNAIAAFIAFEWRADGSPFDGYLRGEVTLDEMALAGKAIFYGRGGCAECHSGVFQTDHDFHAMGDPQIGPGKAARFESHSQDVGRMRVTGAAADAYKFRTPSLRNVLATGPYGHAGAHRNLDAYLRHHIDPARGLDAYEREQALLQPFQAEDFSVMDVAAERRAIQATISLESKPLADDDINKLIAFLKTLTDQAAIDGRLGIPQQVPSGLPVDR